MATPEEPSDPTDPEKTAPTHVSGWSDTTGESSQEETDPRQLGGEPPQGSSASGAVARPTERLEDELEVDPDLDPGPDPDTNAEVEIEAELPYGTVVGEYVVETKVSEGGMSTVYCAHHPVIGKKAALKVLSPSLSQDPTIVKRFVQEARAVNRIGHPNIVDVFSFGKLPDGRSYFLMEWLAGETLAARLDRGPMSLGKMLDVLQCIVDALDAVHAHGIVHRDLKPANVMLARVPGNRQMVKLLDFGIAKLFDDGTDVAVTKAGLMMGTPGYVSPEQARCQPVDARSDLYALGVITFQMVLGERPFEAQSVVDLLLRHVNDPPPRPSDIWPDIPPALDRMIFAMLSKDPHDRPKLSDIRATLTEVRASTDPKLKRPRPQGASAATPMPRVPSASLVRTSGPTPTDTVSRSAQPSPASSPLPRGLLVALSGAFLLVCVGLLWLLSDPAPADSSAAAPPPAGPSQPSALDAAEPLSDGGGAVAASETVEPPAAASGSAGAATAATVAPSTAAAAPSAEAPAAAPARQATPAPPARKVSVPKRAPTRQFGSLTINARPWVRVSLDGRDVAKETPLRNLRVEAGNHVLVFSNPALEFRVQYKVRIAADAETSLFVDVKSGEIRVE